MPLFENSRPCYINRKRIFVDTDQRDKTRSNSEFDFIFKTGALYENVVSIELVDYTIKTDLQTTFYEASGEYPGNNYIDIYLQDTDEYFTTVIPPCNCYSQEYMATVVQDALNSTAGMPFTWVVQAADVRSDGAPRFDFSFDVGTPANTTAQFLFKTGANARNSAARALGFSPDKDTPLELTALGTTFFSMPFDPLPPVMVPFQYFDVHIMEAPELDPVARISLVADDKKVIVNSPGFESDKFSYTTCDTHEARPRLLTQPIKRLDELHVVCTLGPGKIPPLSRSLGGIDLVFDILVVTQDLNVPEWAKHEFLY